MQGLFHIKKAIANLNPEQVRLLAGRNLRIGIYAASPESFVRIENFLLSDLRPERRSESARYLVRESGGGRGPNDLTIFDEGVLAPPRSIVFHSDRTDVFVTRVLDEYEELGLPLARAFPPFRRAFVDRVVAKTCKENTLFSLTTALPDIIPSIIELPWAIAEFASDTAFITMNQLKMAFQIAAASDRPIGYREQKSEIATVIASAFGWRAIARQVVGKIPFGGGLIGKAAIAYAGTKVVGLSLDRLYAIGYTYSVGEREGIYEEALRQGKKVAGRILNNLRPDLAAKFGAAETDKPHEGAYRRA